MNLDTIFSRFDEECYQDILGKEIVGTLRLLGSEYLYSDNLFKILKNSVSNAELISNKISRDIIIDTLKITEIKELYTLYFSKPSRDLYDSLKGLKYGKANLKKLAQFFEIELPEKEKIDFKSVEEIVPNYPLYDYQRNVIDRMEQYLKGDRNRVLLHMPTGSGKTRTTISYICHFLVENKSSNVVWLANTKELLEQAFGEFKRAWSSLGNRKINAVRYWDKSSEDLSSYNNSFIVAGLDKLYSLLMSDFESVSVLGSKTSLVIMDEAHMAIAPTYELLIQNLLSNKASLIGLSATPGRTWNNKEEDEKLSNFFFRQKVMLQISGYSNPIDYLTENGYLAKVKNTRLFNKVGIELTHQELEFLKKNYRLSENALKKISEDKQRNMALISKIEALVERHKRIILFGITVYHSKVLSALLTAMGIKSFCLTSSTPSYDRAKIIEEFKQPVKISPEPVVLCNYGILTTGFDAPEITCAVIARPTDSLVLYSQMVGRAIRGTKSGGSEEAEIVTVIDENLPGFKEVAEAFINWEDVWNNN